MVNTRKPRNMKDLPSSPRRAMTIDSDDHEELFPDMPSDGTPSVARSFATPYTSRFVPEHEAVHWQDLPLIAPETDTGAKLVDQRRETSVSRAFDLLRTRLRQTLREHGWQNIAITAPTAGCGNTFTAVNLAQSLARVPSSRTLLMDFNMRSPGVAQALGLNAQGPIADFLTGDTPLLEQICRTSPTLAVATNSAAENNAAEILQAPATQQTLERMRSALRPEVVLYDMPPLLGFDDVSAFLPQLDGVLLVSDGTQTQAKHLKECERILEGQVPLLGVILNRARPSSIENFT
ncbi:MAG: CpsD/CapB family tyrosine-protein kinase [Sulfitobacter sp.]